MRYKPVLSIATGGMAEIFLGTTDAHATVRPLVAIKRPHPHLLRDRAFKESLLHEARIAARIHHANVVAVRDVIVDGERVDLIMEYIEGVSLAELLEKSVPPAVAIRIVLDACAGLHAAHELTDDEGKPLGLVHRDVSPHNILVGLDGVARVTDFGVAKSLESRARATTEGALKGKASYMAPEYIDGRPIDRRADVFALGIVLWEALANDRLFKGRNEGEILVKVVSAKIPRLREVAPELADAIDPVLGRALERVPEGRWPSARAFGSALEEAARPDLIATYEEVGSIVRALAGEALAERRKRVREAPRAKRSRTPYAIGGALIVATAIAIAARAPSEAIKPEPIATARSTASAIEYPVADAHGWTGQETPGPTQPGASAMGYSSGSTSAKPPPIKPTVKPTKRPPDPKPPPNPY
jgi:serine/threonine protein kinase